MSREEIVDGLRLAMNKGENLMQAMMSFYNAGYSKDDVEAAARELTQPRLPQTTAQPTVQQRSVPKVPLRSTNQAAMPMENQPQPSSSKYYQPHPVKSSQKVSHYGGKSSSTGTVVTIILVVMLLLLSGFLVSLIFFKSTVLKFFGVA